MIIDFHTHTFPEKIAAAAVRELSGKAHIKAHTAATNAALTASMEKNGIDRAVILPVATSPKQVVKVNDSAARTNEECPRLQSFGCMHPDFEGYRDELARMKEMGLKGVKLHPVYQGADIDDIRFLRIIERAAEVGLIVITHAGLDVGFPGRDNCSPKMIRHVVEEIGDFPFVAAHMGGWKQWEDVITYLSDTGASLDTSFSTEEMEPLPDGYWDGQDITLLDAKGFMRMKEIFGAERLLFGTDSPWSEQGSSLAFIRQLPLTEEEREKILGENAVKLLWES